MFGSALRPSDIHSATNDSFKHSLLGSVHNYAEHRLAVLSGCTDSSVNRGQACRNEQRSLHINRDWHAAALGNRERHLQDSDFALAKWERADCALSAITFTGSNRGSVRCNFGCELSTSDFLIDKY